MTEKEEKMRQCLWLSELVRQTGLNGRHIRQLLKTWNGLEELMVARPRSLAEAIQGPPDRVNRLLAVLKDKKWLEKLGGQAAEHTRNGIMATFCEDSDFPDRLKTISGCPLTLYYRGDRYHEIMNQPYFVTIIGTRTPSAYGRLAAEQITTELAAGSIVIVSGLARGIDGLAHKSALKVSGMTIAVVANGPDLAYPPEHEKLLAQIADCGLVISEHPPGTPPRRQHFPARNRILSGLSDAVAVIEASRDSGTMITAGFAGDQGRDVFAVPGSIFSPYSQGCNQLIRDGAELLESAQDLLWRLPVGSIQAKLEQWIRREQPADLPSAAENASGKGFARQLGRLLAGCSLTLAEIAAAQNIPIEEAAGQLTVLELEGRVICERGRYSLTEPAFFCI